MVGAVAQNGTIFNSAHLAELAASPGCWEIRRKRQQERIMADKMQAAGRPSRNMLWLIGVAIVAVLVTFLALNTNMSEEESAGHDFTSTNRGTPVGGVAGTGTGAPGG